MKKLVAGTCIALFAVATLTVSGYAQGNDLQWAAAPIQIDGFDQEWQDAVFMVHKKSKAEYAMRNDGKNLYILFVFKNRQGRSSIDRTGMKIYFNLEGKKKKTDGIHFFMKQATPDELIASLEAEGQALSDEQKAEIRKRPGYLIYESVIIKGKNAPTPADPGVPFDLPMFRVQNKEGVGYFEFRVPLVQTAKGGVVAAPGQAVKLGFEWGGMTSEMMSAQMARAADSGSSASGSEISTEAVLRGGSERADSGRNSSGLRRDRNALKQAFWVDVKLAKQNQ